MGVGTFNFNTACTATTLKYVTAWYDATLKGNSTAFGLFTSSYLSGDSGVDIYQLDMASISQSSNQSEGNKTAGGFNQEIIIYGIAFVSVTIIAGVCDSSNEKSEAKCFPSCPVNKNSDSNTTLDFF